MLTRAEFWQRAAAVAFSAWALMIPAGIALVRSAVGEIVSTQQKQIDSFNAYVLTMERRTTLIEERQSRVLRMLEEHDRRLDGLELQRNGTNGSNGNRR